MTNTVKSFHDLVAWQKAMELVTEIYKVSQKFPKEEMFGLTSQIRRAAVSIPSNIAEGRGKSSTGEFQQFLYHARGSLAEVETQLLIAINLGYLKSQNLPISWNSLPGRKTPAWTLIRYKEDKIMNKT